MTLHGSGVDGLYRYFTDLTLPRLTQLGVDGDSSESFRAKPSRPRRRGADRLRPHLDFGLNAQVLCKSVGARATKSLVKGSAECLAGLSGRRNGYFESKRFETCDEAVLLDLWVLRFERKSAPRS